MKKTFKDIAKYKKQYTSESGENGIISGILKKLNITTGTLIEFGASDGKFNSNTYHLLETGKWKCVYIEPHDKYEELKKLKYFFPDNLITLNIPVQTKKMLTYYEGTSLDEIIDRYCPEGVDLVSIDIDTYDYYIFQELEYRPKIIVIEINASFNEDVQYIDRQNPLVYGTSYLSMIKLGKEKGYEPVIHEGSNLFFIRKDLCEGFEMPEIKFDNTKQIETGIVLDK